MTPEQRRAKADRFRLWMEQDGLGEHLASVKRQYIERIALLDQVSDSFPDQARILTSAAKIVDVVIDHITRTIQDGKVADDEITRMTASKRLSTEQRRWVR